MGFKPNSYSFWGEPHPVLDIKYFSGFPSRSRIFTECFGVQSFLCNFAPHFGVECSKIREEYLSHAPREASDSVEN